ncbi:FAD-dependent oxidoreductase [Nocardia sp. NPDC005825]|uniref:FAD-dependent oxidoreductase n=1 Tax=unclassified Nocardia TaxID=2637762 RepID=UPI0033E61F58
MDRAAPVCIVGAGQTGILAAAALRDLGFENIVVREAGDQLGGYSQNVEVDGEIYDFQAHLVAQQDFGADMAGTAVDELMARHPLETQAEALHFVSRSRSGKPRMAVPPHFVPLLQSLSPEQAADQLVEAWTIVERAVRARTGPGLDGLAYDRVPGETWESYRARHAPLVGEVLQGLMIYANMRRPRQPADTVINANAHICGHVSQLAKMLLALYPEHRTALLARMPESLIAQMNSAKPISLSFPSGFRSFLRRIAEDNRLDIALGNRVTGIEPLRPGEVLVTHILDGTERSDIYNRVIITVRPPQIRQLFPTGEFHALFSERNCPPAWTRSYLIRTDHEPLVFPRHPDSPEPLGFWLIDPYGSYTDTDPAQSLHRITAVNKQHPGPYWVCFSNSDLSISAAEAWALAKDSLFLFPAPELITETIAEWPAYPSAEAIREGWLDRVGAIQGRDGIYVLGEILSGPTLECISDHVRTMIPAWFAARSLLR